MPDIRPLDDSFAVAPQLTTGDLPAVLAAGYRTIINNRPDAEETGQPQGGHIHAAALVLGLDYHAIPFGAQGIGPHEMNTTRAILNAADGPVLAFCRSGTRSCNLWAIARAAEGDPTDALVAKAAAAGYDLRPLAPTLAALSGQ